MESGKEIANKGSDSHGDQSEFLGFSVEHMDESADPWTDFFTYAVGKWVKTHPVPHDQSTWGAFEALRERNTDNLKDILGRCKSAASDDTGDIVGKLGNFYASALDTATIEKIRFSPIESYMAAIERVKSREELLRLIADFHSSGISPFFRAFSRADKKNSSIYALYLYQGGLSLPSRDYYLSKSFEAIRADYQRHVERLFSIYGRTQELAKKNASVVLSIETYLAGASRSQVDLRDAEKNYNRFSVPEIKAEFPGLSLAEHIHALGVPDVSYVVVGQPEFFKALNRLLSEWTIEDMKVYLQWNVLNSAAPYLFSEMEDEHFDMFNRKIRGQQEPEPRWKRAVYVADQFLGEALGELYVKENFGEEARKKMAVLVEDIKDVFKDRLKHLPWMTEGTRQQALDKFGRFRAKIGHPEKFRDYSSLVIKRDDYFGNVLRAAKFEIKRQNSRVGLPVDRNEWFMTPPTVNAYFSPPDNEIVFPAGILQPPFFDVNADDPVNYGAIGAVISHEITHGYDDQGRRYDQNGNLRDWWRTEDERNFLERAQEVVNLYNSFEALPGLHVNGELTLGENIADFGGVTIAYDALQRHLKRNPELRKTIDGLTPEQRFFISWGQIWRETSREPEIRRRVTIDPHSPNRFRASAPVYNHPEFERVFARPGNNGNSSSNGRKINIW